MDLRIPRLGIINVNSYKTESSLADVAISAPVNALHKGHVIRVRVQVFLDDTSLSVGLGSRGRNKGNGRGALEIPNRGQIGIGAGNWRNLKVNVDPKDIQ
jgi:hypothetical protein